METGTAQARADTSDFEEILERASHLTLHEEDAAELSILAARLADLLLRLALKRETARSREARQALGQLIQSPETQLFSTALTDRVHRARSPAAAVRVLRDLLKATGGGKSFPAVDQLQLRAARMFGPVVPRLTQKALFHRLREEASPYLWEAEDELLTQSLRHAHAKGADVNLNYLGEEVLGNAEASERIATYCQLAQRSDIDALSLKLSAIEPHLEVRALEETVARLVSRIQPILDASRTREGGPPLLYFDMETYQDLSVTTALVEALLSTAPPTARLGVALQAYIPESLPTAQRLAEASKRRVQAGGVALRIRLVKGANLQMETVLASLHRLDVPIFPQKVLVDAHFKRVLRTIADAAGHGYLTLGVGSHNLFDIAYALLVRHMLQLEGRLDLEMLQGMAGTLGEVVAELVGSLLLYAPAVTDDHFSSAVSYLVRRLDENTSPENFLHDAPQLTPGGDAFIKQEERFKEALQESYRDVPVTLRTQNRGATSHEPETARPLSKTFENAADTDFTRQANRQHIDQCLDALLLHGSLSVEPLIAFASEPSSREKVPGFDPSRPGAPYLVALANQDDIERAISNATNYAPYLLARKPKERALLLLRVAELLERDRGKLIAAMVLDAGKRVQEADIEVSEAVDFAHYYARAALEIEDNLDPRGVTVVTPPWNFPLAIPLGGALAALAAGNPVIVKPAPETPLVAFLAVRLCHEANIPKEALAFVPCRDESARKLIEDSRVQTVVLTGATATARLFRTMRPDLVLMAETGGKNGAYVAPVSDREHAVVEIVRSAFGHSGQKCSALSQLVLHREVFEDESFRRALLDAVKSLPVGSAWNARSVVTPLIHPPAGALLRILESGEKYGTWLLRPAIDKENPRLVSPGILWGVEPGSFPQQTEFFGPVLSVLRADSIEEALSIINSTPYGLTAGLFSLEEGDHDKFVNGIDAGNVYINRGITGAVVGRQPFGGHKGSSFGPGAKAGGPDYVRQMTVCRASALKQERVLRTREDDYEKAYEDHFAKLVPGTSVVGEDNYLRYLPGRTAVVLGAGAEAMEIRFALSARRICRCDFPLLIVAGEDADRTRQVLGSEGIRSVTDHAAELAEHAKALGVERLRVIGTPPKELFDEANRQDLTVICDPVSDVGRQELALYLRSQCISYAHHRHGNTSFRRLSRLEEALDGRNR